jgi:hypothetical protein
VGNAKATSVVVGLTRLAGGVVAPTTRAPVSRRFASEVRPLIGGAGVAPAAIGLNQLKGAVRAVAAARRSVQLVHVGKLVRASDVVKEPDQFYETVTERLFEYVNDTSADAAEAADRLLGADLVRGRQLSLDERTMRLVKALMTMSAELIAHGEDPARVLLDPRWLDATVEFSRGYIMRSGYEHGLRFELRQMIKMEALASTQLGRALQHQRRLPGMAGRQLYSGPDTILHQAGLAYLIQLKAFRNLESLFGGHLSLKEELGLVKKVSGPAIPKQIVTDILRCAVWDYRIPGAGMSWHELGLPTNPATLALWDEVATTSVYVVDDVYLLNGVMALLSNAVRRTRRVQVDLVNDVDAPIETIDFLADMLGGYNPSVGDPEAVWDTASAYLLQQLIAHEVDISRYLGRSDVIARLGRRQHAKLVAASQPVGTILTAVGLPP